MTRRADNGGRRGARGAAAAVFACLGAIAAAHAEDGYIRGTLDWQGATRGYLLSVPPDSGTAPLPLVIALHGAGGDGGSFAAETRLGAAANARKMLVVFPDGTEAAPRRRLWNARFCCGAAITAGIDDIGFVGALIDHLAAERPVDRGRIYATGMSNGGMLVYELAATHPDWFAAIAPVASAIGGTLRSGEGYLINAPGEPVPVMMLHGRKDSFVLFDGGASPVLHFPNHWKTSVADALSFWAAADGCAPEPQASEPVPGTLRRVEYPGCQAGSEVVLWEIEQGDHEWPAVNFPSPAGPISAAAEILRFFAAHSRE